MEGHLLRDADILEQLGAIGILRAAVKVGRDTRYPNFSSIFPVLNYAVNHLANKTRLIRSKTMAQCKSRDATLISIAVHDEAGDMLH